MLVGESQRHFSQYCFVLFGAASQLNIFLSSSCESLLTLYIENPSEKPNRKMSTFFSRRCKMQVFLQRVLVSRASLHNCLLSSRLVECFRMVRKAHGCTAVGLRRRGFHLFFVVGSEHKARQLIRGVCLLPLSSTILYSSTLRSWLST